MYFVAITAMDSPPLSDPSNGQAHIIQNGKIALFICNAGYATEGSAISYCIGGKWSFPPPKCK